LDREESGFYIAVLKGKTYFKAGALFRYNGAGQVQGVVQVLLREARSVRGVLARAPLILVTHLFLLLIIN
jgi:hypothetical protein